MILQSLEQIVLVSLIIFFGLATLPALILYVGTHWKLLHIVVLCAIVGYLQASDHANATVWVVVIALYFFIFVLITYKGNDNGRD